MSPLDVDRSVLPSPSSRKRGSFPSTSLASQHIQDALSRSTDNGATLVLMKKNFSDVSSDAAEELATIGRDSPQDESSVQRISLGYNRLATLPMEFALLSRLRYLNLKNNCFSVFPDVLTVMPSLDTLDISHNKIKRLPSQPGDLVHLRVFCFSRNKITRLPAYLSKFHKLAVLEVDRNPIEWPPKSIMERHDHPATAESAKSWIRSVQKWMDADSHRGHRGHDDSGFSEQHSLESRLDDAYTAWSAGLPRADDFDDGVTPHARSFSIDSNFSMSSIADSVDIETPSSSLGQSDRPPPLHLGILQSYSSETSPTHSMESYLPSPANSDSFFDNVSTNGIGHDRDSDQRQSQSQQHARNASYAAGSTHSSPRVEFLGKMSMPDLRTAKLNFTKKLPDMRDRGMPSFVPSTTSTPTNSHRNNLHDEFSIPSPLSQRQDSSGSSTSTHPSRPATRPFARGEPAAHSSPTRAVPSMAFERNSYFRRISSLPTATISNTLPTPLLHLVDTARSILFAVCQIYQTLEHYTLNSIDDRLSSVLKKVLHPASADMMQFINSLDRFDAMSRKTVPPPPVCRGVVESCKDTVAVFAKTVGVLSLQIKVIVNVDDLRYLRSLLLSLYGATAEITLAWQGMIPLIESIRPYLHSKPFPAPLPPSLVGLGSLDAHSGPASAPVLVSSSSLLDHGSPPLVSLRTPSSGARTHTARRHAGSFSYKDLEIGKKLPSYEDMPSLTGGIALHTPTLRTPKRQLTSTTLTIQAPSPTGNRNGNANVNGNGVPVAALALASASASASSSSVSIAESSRAVHSRSGSQTSLQASSTSSSPSIPPAKTSFLELPSTSKTLVDNEALQAVQAAVEVAPAVWDMMQDVLADTIENRSDIRESLDSAREVTRRLSDMIRAIKEGDASADKKSLREDAHVFLKTVVQLSNIVKTYGGARSAALRTKMVKLTNSTEEFAILLHVSSFSPASSSASRPYSPMLSASSSQPSLLNLPEEARLGPGLSRSRSAQPSVALKIPSSPAPEAPRSAQPSQSFKVPAFRRMKDRTRLDVNDPG